MTLETILALAVMAITIFAGILVSNLVMIKIVTGEKFTKRYMRMVMKVAWKEGKKFEEKERLLEERREKEAKPLK